MKHLTRLLNGASEKLVAFRNQERGATATEYSLLVGFIAIVIVAGVGLFGTALNSSFGFLTTGIRTALGIP
ncbi:pilus assembly protein Flp/PilA [Pseudarthrobacter sp. W1I19]|uniref:Flp family type IVb pilin n=1 Tax=Pseudarthrobacter sp. W1I19 TaxID=3042288 RepID=UPI002785D92D|nr:Flp family type IVb pilin [Pseudarthrobacter sp. W1I19]MDQ0922617.1 pilus assembly protein Flp/PilA [Pseudarthrobacter sp. W1I19]